MATKKALETMSKQTLMGATWKEAEPMGKVGIVTAFASPPLWVAATLSMIAGVDVFSDIWTVADTFLLLSILSTFWTAVVAIFSFIEESSVRRSLKRATKSYAVDSINADENEELAPTLADYITKATDKSYVKRLSRRQMNWIEYTYNSQFDAEVKRLADKRKAAQEELMGTGNTAVIAAIGSAREWDVQRLHEINKAYTHDIAQIGVKKPTNDLEEFDRQLQS